MLAGILTPPPERTADAWADANRYLPAGSAEPGRVRTSRTPYVVPICRAFSPYWVSRVVFAMARQMGKTQGVVFNVLGWRLDDAPVPVLYVGPTEGNVLDVIEPKVQDLLETTPSLWAKTARGQDNKRRSKLVAGMPLRLAWAGSDSQLKADSMGLAFVDEIDGVEAERRSAGEGTVVDMVEAITKSYPDSKVGITSTPTYGHAEVRQDPRTGLEHWLPGAEVVSAVWSYWSEGSRHEWAWPCPECREYFIPRSKLLYPSDGPPEEAEDKGAVVCPHCGALLGTERRTWQNLRGAMVAPGLRPLAYREDWGTLEDGPGYLLADHTRGEEGAPVIERVPWGDVRFAADLPRSTASFWVSGLATFTAKTSYGFIAAKLLRARESGREDRIQGVFNTDLGEVYKPRGDAPPWSEVLERRGAYARGEVPTRATTLTGGVDVQSNRLVYVVRAWAPAANLESYLVDWGELWGETDQPEVWQQLGLLLGRDWDGLQIGRMAIDSGYRPDAVYSFVSENPGVAMATKGQQTMDRPLRVSAVEVSPWGRSRKLGVQLWHLNTDVGKSWVHSRIRWPPDQPGTWSLPKDVDEEYCKQVTAESRTVRADGTPLWFKIRSANHYLDAEVGAYFAMRVAQIREARPKVQAARGREPLRAIESPEVW